MKDPPKPCQYRIKSLGRKGHLTESLMLSAVIIPRRPQPLISGWIISYLIQPKQRRHYSVSKISRERKILFIQTRKYFFIISHYVFQQSFEYFIQNPNFFKLSRYFFQIFMANSRWISLPFSHEGFGKRLVKMES